MEKLEWGGRAAALQGDVSSVAGVLGGLRAACAAGGWLWLVFMVWLWLKLILAE